MAFKTATLVGSTFTAGPDNTITDALIGAVSGPFKAFSTAAEADFISERESGMRSLIVGVAGFLGGDIFGNKRAASGKGPLLSMFG